MDNKLKKGEDTLINESFIKVKAYWGHDIYNLFLAQTPKSVSY